MLQRTQNSLFVLCAFPRMCIPEFSRFTSLNIRLSRTNSKSLIVKEKKRLSYITQHDAAVRIYLNLFVSKKRARKINSISFNSWCRLISILARQRRGGGSVKLQNQSLAGAKLNLKCKLIWRSNMLQPLYHFNQAKSRHWQSREVLEIPNSPNASSNLD